MSKFRQADRKGWRQYLRTRSQIMARKPMCAICLVELAVETHHLVPLARGGSNGPDNLLPMCRKCHEHEHASAKNRKKHEAMGMEEAEGWDEGDWDVEGMTSEEGE